MEENFTLQRLYKQNKIQQRRIKELEVELEKHRWIPVSERLPENDKRIWILYKESGFTYSAFYDQHVLHQYKTWQIYDYSGGYKEAEANPTYWKPIILPSKP